MPFRTKDEIFGDNAGFGPEVPIDTTNPPGTAATNRGLVDSEPVSAAQKNRTPAALAENTDDLNERLLPFETDGLDAAYRGGVSATPGSGRIIHVDGEAVELYTDRSAAEPNTSLLVNSVDDTVDGMRLIDLVSGVDPLTGFTGTGVALLDRRRMAMRPGASVSELGLGIAATLNPGGAGGFIIQINAGRLITTVGGDNRSDLFPKVDLVEVSGAGASNGLYLVHNFLTDARLTAQALAGTFPSFPADTAATVTFYRPRLATWGPSGNRSEGSQTTVMAAMPGMAGGTSALDLIGVRDDVAVLTSRALRVRFTGGALGDLQNGGGLDIYGRFRFDLRTEQLTAYQSNALHNRALGGAFATLVDRTEPSAPAATEIAHQVKSSPNISGRLDFLSLVPFDASDTVTQIEFVITSPSNGGVLATSVAGNWLEEIVNDFTILEITSPGHRAAGYYWISDKAGPAGLTLTNLHKGVPSNLPTSGVVNVSLFWASWVGNTLQSAGSPIQNSAGATLHATESLANITPGSAFYVKNSTKEATPITSIVRGTTPSLFRGLSRDSSGNLFENFRIAGDGSAFSRGRYRYERTRVTTRYVDLAKGTSTQIADPGWQMAGMLSTFGNWQLRCNANTLWWVLPLDIPDGAIPTEINCLVTPGTVRSGTNTMYLQLVGCEANAITGVADHTLLGSDQDDETDARQGLTVSAPPLSPHVAGASKFFARIRAGNTAGANPDLVHAFYVSFVDPGPTN